MFTIDPVTEEFTTDTQITLKFPFISSTSVQNFELAIPSSGQTWYLKSLVDGSAAVDTAFIYSTTTVTTTPSSYGSKVSGSNLGSLAFKIVTAPSAGHITYFAAKSVSGTQISLPRFSNNAATRYEAYLETKDTKSTTTLKPQLATYQLNFPANTLGAGISVFCVGLLNTLPIKLLFAPSTVAVPAAASGTTFYLELDFTDYATGTDLGSGLSNGNDYPYSVSGTTFTSFVLTVATAPLLKAKLTSALATSGFTYTLYTSIYSNDTTFTGTHRTYYTIDTDPRNKYITHESTAPAVDMSAAVGTSIALTGLTADKIISISTAVTSIATDASLRFYGTFTITNTEWAFTYPMGWTIASTATVFDYDDTTGLAATVISPSSNSTTCFFFKHSTMLLTESGTTAIVTGNIGLTGPVTSAYKTPDASMIIGIGGTDAWGSACVDYQLVLPATFLYKMVTSAITVTSISPSSIKGRGPASVNLSETVVFTVPNLIPAGGKITVNVDNGWSITGASLTVFGLTNQSTYLTILVIKGSFVWTITQFAEVSASSTITLTFTGLLPPIYGSTTSALTNFLSSITLAATIASTDYDISTTASSVPVTIAAATATGRSTFITKTTYPQTAIATDVDLYLKFTLTNSVPKGGLIELTSPLTYKISSTNTKNQVWLSPLKYSAVSFSSSTLTLTLAEDYSAGSFLELFIENAVDNPTSTITTTTGFTLKSSWGGTTIDTDISQIIQPSQQFTATAPLTTTLSPSPSNSLTLSPPNAGEYASYSFSFKSSVKFATGDQILIEFPDQFDPYLGEVWTYKDEAATTSYIQCASAILTTLSCRVDNRRVLITSAKEVEPNTEITLSVRGVVNPPSSTTDSFRLLHTDSQGLPKSFNLNFGTVTSSPAAAATSLKMVELSNEDNFYMSGSVKCTFLLAIDLLLNDLITIGFPPEFELSDVIKVSCRLSARNKLTKQWSSSTSACSVVTNSVQLKSSQTLSTTSFDLIAVTVLNTPAPLWGSSLPESTLDYITKVGALDASHSFYDLLTGPFTVSVGDQTTLKSKTAQTLSRSSAGFIKSDQSLSVNDNDPQDPSPIVAFAGTASIPISISLSSPSTIPFKLVPSVSPRSNAILLTSPTNFTFEPGMSSITFNVLVAGSLSEGLYSVSFADEGGIASLRPPKTYLKTTQLKEKLLISVGDLPVVAKGVMSDFVHISCPQPPATEVIVEISQSSPSVSVTPNSFKMTGETSEFDFRITVSENANLTTQIYLNFTLSGSDAAAFRIPSNLPLNITESSNSTQSQNRTLRALGFNSCQRTACSMTPNATLTGSLYWHLRSKGKLALSFLQIQTRLTEKIGNFTSDLEKVKASENFLYSLYSDRESTPQLTETFPDFQTRLLQQHLKSDWVGLSVILDSLASVTYRFYWLFPDTEYDVTAYLDDGATSPPNATESFKTYPAYASQPFKVGLKDSSESSLGEDIKELAAQQQGVPAYQLGNSDSPSRRLQSGGFSYVLYTDLNNQNQNPANQAKISGPVLDKFRIALVSLGVELDSIDNLPIPPRVPPKWVQEPSVNGTNQTAVLVSFQADSAGQSCCIAVESPSTKPSPQQVKSGLSAENVAVSSGCVQSNPNSKVLLLMSNLTEASPYSMYCIAHDDTPITPTYMEFDNNEVPEVSFNTAGLSSDLSSLLALTLWSIAISFF